MVSVDDERADKKSLPHVLPVAIVGTFVTVTQTIAEPADPAPELTIVSSVSSNSSSWTVLSMAAVPSNDCAIGLSVGPVVLQRDGSRSFPTRRCGPSAPASSHFFLLSPFWFGRLELSITCWLSNLELLKTGVDGRLTLIGTVNLRGSHSLP